MSNFWSAKPNHAEKWYLILPRKALGRAGTADLDAQILHGSLFLAYAAMVNDLRLSQPILFWGGSDELSQLAV